MSQSSASLHIDKRVTSLEITGTKDCTNPTPALFVYGGARFAKTVCMDSNLMIKEDLSIQGNLLVQGNTFLNQVFAEGVTAERVTGNTGEFATLLIDTLSVEGKLIANTLCVLEDTHLFGNLQTDGHSLMNTITANCIQTYTANIYGPAYFFDNVYIDGNIFMPGSGGMIHEIGNCILAADHNARVCALNGNIVEINAATTHINGNLDMECGVIANVMDLYVHALHGKSPIEVHDNFDILDTVGGGKITYVGGIEIGDLTTTALASSAVALGKGAHAAADSVAVGTNALSLATVGQQTAVGSGALQLNTTGTQNTAVGYNALLSTTSGGSNSAMGFEALKLNTTGTSNTAVGNSALSNNTTQPHNTAVGNNALLNNVSGGSNTAVGSQSLVSNSSGGNLVAVGMQALQLNTTGISNTGVGFSALRNNSTGDDNVAIGYQALSTSGVSGVTAVGSGALQNNTTGGQNVAVGFNALQMNTTGGNNTAVGIVALSQNTIGSQNTAVGSNAMISNVLGTDNAALGFQALRNANSTGNSAFGSQALLSTTSGSDNTAVGQYAINTNTTGNFNTALGSRALYTNLTGNDSVAIGYLALTLSTVGQQTAVGSRALRSNTTGSQNTAVGYNAMQLNSSASSGTALGYQALQSNTTGSANTALGAQTLAGNTTGSNNTAVGTPALTSNTTGANNTAVGASALGQSTTASNNTAIGAVSLNANLTGTNNSALGTQSLAANQTGNNNSALGYQALLLNTTSSDNTAMGYRALALNTAPNNSAFGSGAMYSNKTGSFGTAIGYQSALANETGYYNTSVGANSLMLMGGTYSVGTASQSGTTITGVGTTFNADMVGGTIVFSALFQQAPITAYVSATSLTSSTSQTVSPTQAYTIYYGPFYNIGTASQSGTTITGVNTRWLNPNQIYDLTGGYIIYSNGRVAQIVSVVSNTSIVADRSLSVGSSTYIIYYGGSNNNAVGYNALASARFTQNSIAMGNNALGGPTVSNSMIAIGNNALATNQISLYSQAIGENALNKVGRTSTYSQGTISHTFASRYITGVGTNWTSDMIGSLILSPIFPLVLTSPTLYVIQNVIDAQTIDVGTSTGANYLNPFAGQSYTIFFGRSTSWNTGYSPLGGKINQSGDLVTMTDGGGNTNPPQEYWINYKFEDLIGTTIRYSNGAQVTVTELISKDAGTLRALPAQNIVNDNAPVLIINSAANIAIGTNSMKNVSQARDNVAIGTNSAQNLLFTTKSVVIGSNAMNGTGIGSQAQAVGAVVIGGDACRNASGGSGTYIGYRTNYYGTALGGATAIGFQSLMLGGRGTAVGTSTLLSNQGNGGVAVGSSALTRWGVSTYAPVGATASQLGNQIAVTLPPNAYDQANYDIFLGSTIVFANFAQAPIITFCDIQTLYLGIDPVYYLVAGGAPQTVTQQSFTIYTGKSYKTGTLNFTFDTFFNTYVVTPSGGAVLTPDMSGSTLILANGVVATLFYNGFLSDSPQNGIRTPFYSVNLSLISSSYYQSLPNPTSTFLLEPSSLAKLPPTGSIRISRSAAQYFVYLNLPSDILLPTSVITVTTTAGFTPTGQILIGVQYSQSSQIFYQIITYTGLTATTFTGCTGGVGRINAGVMMWPVYQYLGNNQPNPLVFDTITYTGKSSTALTGCTTTAPSTMISALSAGQPVSSAIINVISTTGFAYSAQLLINNTITISYTSITPTSFNGCGLVNGSGTFALNDVVAVVYTNNPLYEFPSSSTFTLYYPYNESNLAIGDASQSRLTTGRSNTTVGNNSMLNAVDSSYNVAIGTNSMATNLNASFFGGSFYYNGETITKIPLIANNCVAVGYNSLRGIESACGQTAIGYNALANSTCSGENTAVGDQSLWLNGHTTALFIIQQYDLTVTIGINNPSLTANATPYDRFTPDMVGGTIVYQLGFSFSSGVDYLGQFEQSVITGYINETNITVAEQRNSSCLARIYYGIQYKDGTISQSGSTVTGVGTVFTREMVGGNIVFDSASGSLVSNITGFVNSTTLTVTPSQTVSAGSNYRIYYGGSSNTAIGSKAMLNNTIGMPNTAVGSNALLNINSGKRNTASGFDSLQSTTTGYDNTATGDSALGIVNIVTTGIASQSGTVITGQSSYFNASMSGGTIVYQNYATTNISTLSDGVDVSTVTTINVLSTAPFPSLGGTIRIVTSLTTILMLPAVSPFVYLFGPTLPVRSTAFFPSAGGQFLVQMYNKDPNLQYLTGDGPVLKTYVVTYTSIVGNSFLGCTTTASGLWVAYNQQIVAHNPQIITYTSTTPTSFVGVAGTRNGKLSTSSLVQLINLPQTLVTYTSPTTLTASTSLPSITSRPFTLYYGTSYSSGTINSQTGLAVAGSGTSWTSSMVGGHIIYSNGECAQITSVSSATSLSVDRYPITSPVMGSTYIIYYGGARNTAVGSGAGASLTTGFENTLIGAGADSTNGNKTVGVGHNARVNGNGNVVVGDSSTDNGQSNVIVLGSGATAASGNQVVIGSGISALSGSVSLTNYIQINIGGTVYKIPIGI